MADLAAMNIVIGANTAPAEAGIKKVAAELTHTAEAAMKVDSTLDATTATIVRDVSKAVSAVAYLPKSFDEVRGSVDKLAADFHTKWDKIVDDAQELAPAIKADTAAVNQLTAAQQRLAPAAAKATAAMASPGITKTTRDFTGLSRVIQDLPYGFQGISNNLTQILPAAGALGLAISAITTAISFAQIGFGAWTRGLTDNKEALEDNKKAQEALYKDAGGDIGRMLTLVNAAKNVNLSMSERINAIKLLKNEFPTYFAALEQEKFLNGEVGAAVQKTTNLIFQQALVRQKSAQLGEAAAQIHDLEQQQKALELEEKVAARSIALAGKTRSRDKIGITGRLYGAGSQDTKALDDVHNRMDAVNEQLIYARGNWKKLTDVINSATAAAGLGLFDPGKVEKEGKKTSKEIL